MYPPHIKDLGSCQLLPRQSPLTKAILSASLALQCLALIPCDANATPNETITQQKNFSIAAGPLGPALTRFSGEAGVVVSFDANLTAGRQTAGLKGAYSVEQGFATLLDGSGLQAQKVDEGTWLVSKAPQAGSMELSPLSIKGQQTSTATEGTGSYTTATTSTATKMNLSIKETPQSISVVTRQRMDDQALQSITDVLEQTPGVTISRDSSERFNIYSRGSEITKYQYDGVTTSVQNQTQTMTQNLADMAIYDKVEIVRGATGLMTGAGVPGGVVNMVRKKPTDTFQASVEGSVGRWDYKRSQIDVSGPLIDSGKLRARLVTAKQENDTFTDDYSQAKDVLYGVVEADVTDTTTVRFGIDYEKYKVHGVSGVPLMYSDGSQTNFSRSTSAGAPWSTTEFDTTNYFFNVDQQLAGEWKLNVGGNFMDVNRHISGASVYPTPTSGVERATGNVTAEILNNVQVDQTQKSLEVNIQGPFTLFGREHQAIFGYNFQRYKNNHDAYGSSYPTVNIFAWDQVQPTANDNHVLIFDTYTIERGYYAATRLNPMDDLHVILGARVSDYEFYNLTAIPTSTYSVTSSYGTHGEITPYAGIVYDLTPEQSLYASYTDIFQPNSVSDINGKVIDPQVGSNYEVGWKGEFYDGRLNANAAIYHVKRDNATERAGTISGISYYRAISGTETNGYDLELSGEVLPGWSVSGSYSHSRTENADGVRQLTYYPLDTVRLWNTYRFDGTLRNLTIGGGLRWNSKMAVAYAALKGKATQDDYFVTDAMARYRFNDRLSATLNVSNIFDKKYYTAIQTLAYGYYGEPRNATLELKYEF
ncbi:TonB-dependent siderophore receptor [Pseudomonas putida]